MSPSAASNTKRVRASERALRVTLQAMKDAGLAVDKVCITGAQIEIHCGGVEAPVAEKNDGGPEDW